MESKAPTICSICTPHPPRLPKKTHQKLETSFVNVPSNSDTNRNGLDMYNVSRRMEGMLKIMETDDTSFYCTSCLDRIGRALDEQTAMIIDECPSYNEAASKEEERVDSIRGALTKMVNTIHMDVDEGNAVEWALDQFQLEIKALTQASTEQDNEIRILQNLMQQQLHRSKELASREENAFHELNAFERDVYNFNEESHHITQTLCSSVSTEMESLSRVKLISVPFQIDTTQGRYPLIHNLRLAHRINDKAQLSREEINAAWVQAAQLVSFACGLYPRFHSNVRIIPLSYPCAKIQMSGGGGGVYNLGWDGTCIDATNYIPTNSMLVFLSLLSDLVSHILLETKDVSNPPFEMTSRCIDRVDVTKLLDSDVSWSSVVYCMACNMRWLSRLPVRMPCI